MTNDVQKQAEEIFHRVVELSPAERDAYLETHCQDATVRKEVDGLLAHAGRNEQTLTGAFSAELGSCLDGDGSQLKSVLEVLAGELGAISQISLRDARGDESPVAVPLAQDKPELPERVGRYQVAGEIARGGVGSVWKARDIELGRDIALKVLLDAHQGNPDATRRFLEEAQIGAQLQHPGIVPVHDMGLVAGKKPYFAMKLVKGDTLSSLPAERKVPAQDRQRFLSIFEQICQPLAYAHARGVIHRDLKPSNVTSARSSRASRRMRRAHARRS